MALAAVAVIADFQKVVTGGGERLETPIIEDEKIDAAERAHRRRWRPSLRARPDRRRLGMRSAPNLTGSGTSFTYKHSDSKFT